MIYVTDTADIVGGGWVRLMRKVHAGLPVTDEDLLSADALVPYHNALPMVWLGVCRYGAFADLINAHGTPHPATQGDYWYYHPHCIRRE